MNAAQYHDLLRKVEALEKIVQQMQAQIQALEKRKTLSLPK